MADKRLDQTTNASAVAAADNIPFVTAAGVTSYVTGDELAASAPFSSRYKPLASDRLWIPAGAFNATIGSPSFGILGNASFSSVRQDAVLFDASSAEGVSATILIPPGWATFNVFYWWSNAGAGSGDVRWRITTMQFADTDTTDAGDVDSSYTVTAPAQYVAKRSAGPTSVSNTVGEVRRVSVIRSANEAADTLANDAGLIGVELVCVS